MSKEGDKILIKSFEKVLTNYFIRAIILRHEAMGTSNSVCMPEWRNWQTPGT